MSKLDRTKVSVLALTFQLKLMEEYLNNDTPVSWAPTFDEYFKINQNNIISSLLGVVEERHDSISKKWWVLHYANK